jgi:hypothetical protein
MSDILTEEIKNFLRENLNLDIRTTSACTGEGYDGFAVYENQYVIT